jgi:hypothetical protein
MVKNLAPVTDLRIALERLGPPTQQADVQASGRVRYKIMPGHPETRMCCLVLMRATDQKYSEIIK